MPEHLAKQHSAADSPDNSRSPDAGLETTMNDPRDYLAFTRFGNLGILVLSLGLLGILIHRKPARRAVSGGVALLGVALLSEGGALLHGRSVPADVLVVICLPGIIAAMLAGRYLLNHNRKEPDTTDRPS